MGFPIPIVDAIVNVGGKVLDKFFMNKSEKELLKLSKEQLRKEFEIELKRMAQEGELQREENAFREYEAQRAFANDQFGTMQALQGMGLVGKIIALGRASIRWVITGGSMYFTWTIIERVITDATVSALFAGTLGGSAAAILGLLITLVVGIPVFYATGISVEKIMKVRNQL